MRLLEGCLSQQTAVLAVRHGILSAPGPHMQILSYPEHLESASPSQNAVAHYSLFSLMGSSVFSACFEAIRKGLFSTCQVPEMQEAGSMTNNSKLRDRSAPAKHASKNYSCDCPSFQEESPLVCRFHAVWQRCQAFINDSGTTLHVSVSLGHAVVRSWMLGSTSIFFDIHTLMGLIAQGRQTPAGVGTAKLVDMDRNK